MSDPAPAIPSKPSPRQSVNSLRGLLPFLSPHKRLLAAWLGALALSSTATLSLPVAVKHMIDQGFSAGGDIDRWFLLMFGVAVLLAIATALRFYFVSILGERVVVDLRAKLYEHFLSLDQAFYDRSRNHGGTWCDMASCGNKLKNREFRARRRRAGAARRGNT